ncbi:MAG: hypothetical protein LBC60_11795 [Spirochaetaceae bacterium]|jgi:hypothetical protein|nr:hypothetical protein [Spirochaetaceae bacterium]
MPDLTEEEYDALNEYWTKNTPKIDTGKSGFVTRRMGTYMVEVDKLTAAWLRARQEATHQTTTEIIGELVREKISAPR